LIQDNEDAFTDLVLLGQSTWNNDDIKKRRLVQNAQNIGLVDTIFEAGHMLPDMINKPKKRIQDRSIIHANLRVLPRRISSRQLWH
jgi:hypothetical protein